VLGWAEWSFSRRCAGDPELARTPAALDVAPPAEAAPLDAGAILEAAGADATSSAAAPSEPAAIPGAASAAMLEASRADAPAPLPSWLCRCGKASVGAECWNCVRSRPVLTVLPGYAGGRPPDPVRVAALAELASSDDVAGLRWT